MNDESYFGAKHHHGYHGKLKRGRGTLKQPVLGVFKKNGGGIDRNSTGL